MPSNYDNLWIVTSCLPHTYTCYYVGGEMVSKASKFILFKSGYVEYQR